MKQITKSAKIKNLLKIEIQIFVISFEDNTPSREILIVCNQLQANYNSKKTLWNMEELYKKIVDDPKTNQNRLSFERFVEDMNWIISHGLISFHEDKLNMMSLPRICLCTIFTNIKGSWKTKLLDTKNEANGRTR